jgi:integrase
METEIAAADITAPASGWRRGGRRDHGPTPPLRPPPSRRRRLFRTREHLTPGEVEALVEAAKANRHGHRDATMILLAFRHGLRAAELDAAMRGGP